MFKRLVRTSFTLALDLANPFISERKTMKQKNEKWAIQKKSYTAPKLVEYGTISQLTQGTGSKGADGGSGMMN